jgi:L-ascorbate metabolism protein UlaG (beta-lactamase superfamily)
MKYRNIEPPELPPPIGDVLKWAVVDKLWGRRREAPRRYHVPVVPPDTALLASDAPSLTWVGHATWIVRLGGLTLYTDPNWSTTIGPTLSRNVPPGVALEGAPPPDVVLVSHNHRDHLDAPTVARIGGAPTWVVPEGLGHFFRRRGFPRVVELPWWGEHCVKGPGGAGEVRIAFVPSQHWSQRGPFDRNRSLWGGFVVIGEAGTAGTAGTAGRAGAAGDERRIYFAGDTSYFGGFREIGRRHGPLDAALLPIGAYDPEWFMRRQHMNPEDAVRAFRDLGARLLCAMHWGTFKLTDEPLDEPPQELERERQRQGVPATAVWVPAIGESLRL